MDNDLLESLVEFMPEKYGITRHLFIPAKNTITFPDYMRTYWDFTDCSDDVSEIYEWRYHDKPGYFRMVSSKQSHYSVFMYNLSGVIAMLKKMDETTISELLEWFKQE